MVPISYCLFHQGRRDLSGGATSAADVTGVLICAGPFGANELLAEDRLTLERDAEQVHGTARLAVGQAVEHLDAARQVLAVLETRENGAAVGGRGSA